MFLNLLKVLKQKEEEINHNPEVSDDSQLCKKVNESSFASFNQNDQDFG